MYDTGKKTNTIVNRIEESKEFIMKRFKILTLSLMIFSMALLVGCSSDNTNDANDTSGTNEINADISLESINSLKDAANSIVAKVDKATVPDGEEERKNQFFELKKELNSVEDQLDMYDDYLDSQYEQGALSHEQYKKWEKKLDEYEDKIDAAEDKLEKTFGMAD